MVQHESGCSEPFRQQARASNSRHIFPRGTRQTVASILSIIPLCARRQRISWYSELRASVHTLDTLLACARRRVTIRITLCSSRESHCARTEFRARASVQITRQPCRISSFRFDLSRVVPWGHASPRDLKNTKSNLKSVCCVKCVACAGSLPRTFATNLARAGPFLL